jgi:acyl-CoA thioester hydrolase
MFTTIITPRLGEADGLGHINNAIFANWFELARNPIFRIFSPTLDILQGGFPLIMAHAEYDFVKEVFFSLPVEVRTFISRIGTKSFTVYHEAWQDGHLCVTGSTVIVYFDFVLHKSEPIPEDSRKVLEEHLLPE